MVHVNYDAVNRRLWGKSYIGSLYQLETYKLHNRGYGKIPELEEYEDLSYLMEERDNELAKAYRNASEWVIYE